MRYRLCLLPAILLLGCGKGGGKSLAGEWVGGEKSVKSAIRLAADGTFSIVAANDFAGGIAEGTYEQANDHLDLNFTFPQASHISYKCELLGTDKMSLSTDGGGTAAIYQRTGPAPATAKLPQPTPADIAKAQASADSTTCISNVKQLGLATLMYCQDYDNSMPPASRWAQGLLPYAKNEWLFTCPTLRKNNEQGGYAFDTRLDAAKMTAIPDPRSTVMYFESVTKQIGTTDPQTSLLMKPRHDDKISVGYVDGHAQGITR